MTHEISREVGADGNCRDSGRTDAILDFFECRAEGCVAGKVKGTLRSLNIPGAPQCFHAVHRRASRPVLTGSGCHLDIAAGKLGRLPPVHFFDVGDALTPKPRAEAEAHIP